MLYAIIDPRDGEVITYLDGLERAKDYVQFLETSVAHTYRTYDIRLKLALVKGDA